MFVPSVATILAQVPGNSLENLRQVDRLLHTLRQPTRSIAQVVALSGEPVAHDWDVVICGGTLGIFLAATLVRQGWRVLLLERGILQGRQQEWNTSRLELRVFLELGLLSEAELEQAIASEYNPTRLAFGDSEIWVKDILNIGVDPVFLLATLKQRFLEAGGKLLEQTAFEQAIVHPDGIVVQAGGQRFTARLMLDAMGHFSPVVAQARQGTRPDSICLVVGTCTQGIPQNQTGDLFVSFTPIQRQCQYFWEAFPARDGRTTYLFTYSDTDPDRPGLETLFADYLALLPEYQQVSLEQLQIQRALFGLFPCYQKSPLQTPWSRILPVGDSSGNQSPLSFGGFGAMLRHWQRLDQGIEQALTSDVLSSNALALLQPYQPNLSVTWLFQRAMSVRPHQKLDPEQINRLLAVVFQTMEKLGEPVLLPFLRDVIQFPALSQTLGVIGVQHPGLVAEIMAQVGPQALIDWLGHYLNLGIYSGLDALTPVLSQWLNRLSPTQNYYWQRRLDAWKYGSGNDFKH